MNATTEQMRMTLLRVMWQLNMSLPFRELPMAMVQLSRPSDGGADICEDAALELASLILAGVSRRRKDRGDERGGDRIALAGVGLLGEVGQ